MLEMVFDKKFYRTFEKGSFDNETIYRTTKYHTRRFDQLLFDSLVFLKRLTPVCLNKSLLKELIVITFDFLRHSLS